MKPAGLAAVAVVISGSFVAGVQHPAKTAGLTTSGPLLTVSQGGTSVASTPGKVTLRRQPFELVFTLPVDRPVVMVDDRRLRRCTTRP